MSKQSKAWNKLWKNYFDYKSLSRKDKIRTIGRKWNKNKIRRELSKLKIYIQPYPNSIYVPDLFCPDCGCKHTRSTGNMTAYPEIYEYCYCLRCGYAISYADNSPTILFFEEDPEDWKKLGVTFVDTADAQDDTQFKLLFRN